MEHALDTPPNPPADPLAAHLRDLRLAAGLTLSQLADRSGVSRASLSRIETGAVSPTAEVLGRLAAAHGVPISRLLAPMERGFTPLVRRADQPLWQDARHGYRRRNVSPPAEDLRCEMLEGSLTPGQEIAYDGPAMRGQEHHLYLLEGALSVTVEGVEHALRAGDCLRYKLQGASRFRTGREAARYVLVLA